MIKDSGNRQEFDSGAVRDIQEGKGRCDLLPLRVIGAIYDAKLDGVIDTTGDVLTAISEYQETGDIKHLVWALSAFLESPEAPFTGWSDMWLEVAIHFEEGAKKYGEYNWQKGIPTHRYVNSAVRHYLKMLRGDTDEPHDRAFVWNVLCCIWTSENRPQCEDYMRKETTINENENIYTER